MKMQLSNYFRALDFNTSLLFLITILTPIIISILLGLHAQGNFAIIKNNINFISTVLLFGLPQSLLIISSRNKFNRAYLKIIISHVFMGGIIGLIYFYFYDNLEWQLLSIAIFSQLIILIIRGLLIPHINLRDYSIISYGNLPLFLIIALAIFYIFNLKLILLSYVISLIILMLYCLIKFNKIRKVITSNNENTLNYFKIYFNSFFFITRDAANLLLIKIIYDKLNDIDGVDSVGKLSIFLVFCTISNLYISIYGPKQVSRLIRNEINKIQYYKVACASSFTIIFIIFIIWISEIKNYFPRNIYSSIPLDYISQILALLFFIFESFKIITINYFNAIYGPIIPAISELVPLVFILYLSSFTLLINSNNIIYILLFYSLISCGVLIFGLIYHSVQNTYKNSKVY